LRPSNHSARARACSNSLGVAGRRGSGASVMAQVSCRTRREQEAAMRNRGRRSLRDFESAVSPHPLLCRKITSKTYSEKFL
jgi:hypothetical protein